MLDDVDEALAVGLGLGERQGFHGAAQRCQGVFGFMGNIGREPLDGFDAVVERVGHGPQRSRQMPDLVGPVGIIGNFGPRFH